MLYLDPCVYVVGTDYQIAVNTTEFGILWLEIGSKSYRSSRNGLMLSETLIHKIIVPQSVLDEAKHYRVCFRSLSERRPYFPELGALETAEYDFRPVSPDGTIRAYMLADTHSRIDAPCRAAEYWKDDLDLLILNGDIPAESKTHEDIRAIFEITSRLTHGSLPVVFARGNHDYRGRYATDLGDYIGTRNGETYFTFRLGRIWGIVLDCGEDKNDTDIEYGGLVDCHDMRLRETEYLRSVIANAANEYDAEGVTVRIALCHQGFTTRQVECGEAKFDIEREIYGEWTGLLNRMKLDHMLCGHTHTLHRIEVGSEDMRMPTNFPVLIGSHPVRHPQDACKEFPGAEFVGTAIEIKGNEITLTFTADIQ